MAGKRPTDVTVTNLGTLNATDSIPIDRVGVNSAKKTTPANIATYINAPALITEAISALNLGTASTLDQTDLLQIGTTATTAMAGNTTIPSVVGLLDETAHDLLNHTGLTGILALGTTSTTALAGDTQIPSITGLLNETSHDQLDHTGLTGIPTAYTLPIATDSVLGGVKQGTNISIDINGVISSTASGTGDVVGPSSAINSNLAAFDTTTGKLLKDSLVKASDFALALTSDQNYVSDAQVLALHGINDTNTSSTPIAHATESISTVHGGIVASNDGRLTNSRTPTAHAPSHVLTGSDPLTTNFYHGVVSRTTVAPLPTSISTTTFTLTTGTTPLQYYYKGTLVTISTDKSVTVATGKNYIYFSDALGTLTASTSFPDLFSNVLVATVIWNGTDLGLVADERHNHTRDIDWHLATHEDIGTRYVSGIAFSYAGTTNLNTTFAITSGLVRDEDIRFTIGAFTNCRLFYQTSVDVYAFVNTLSNKPYWGGATAGSGIYAVNATTYAQLTINNSARYFNYFVYASTDVLNPIYVLAETTTVTAGHTSVANARLISPPYIGVTNLTTELKLLYRIVVNGAGLIQTPIAADDYRTGGSISGGGTTTVAHNGLSGLELASSIASYGHVACPAVPSTTQFLRDDGAWATPAGSSGGMDNPMTAAGDIIIGGVGGTPTALSAGTNAQVLTLADGVPTWADSTGGAGNSSIDGGAAATSYTTTQNIDAGGA